MLESPPFLMVSSDTRFVAGFYKLYFPNFEVYFEPFLAGVRIYHKGRDFAIGFDEVVTLETSALETL